MKEFSKRSFRFAGLEFMPETAQLICEKREKIIELTPFENRFLMILVTNAGAPVHYEDLRIAVWTGWKGKIESKAQTLKGNLIKKLESCKVDGSFIQAIPKKGYRLAVAVENPDNFATAIKQPGDNENKHLNNDLTDIPATTIRAESGASNLNGRSEFWFRVFGKYAGFTLPVSLIYAVLLWLALMLEIAYQFDIYGTTALRLGFPLVAFMLAATFGSLRIVEIAAEKRQPNGWLWGLSVLIVATGMLCFALLAFLPTVPITLLRDATAQPAFAAFLKNVILYFLPMFIFFVYLPFHAIVSSRQKSLLRACLLAAIWGIALIYSIITHFNMLDRLQPAPFQNLFVSLIFLRFVGYFGLAIIGLIWFYQNTEAAKPEVSFSDGVDRVENAI